MFHPNIHGKYELPEGYRLVQIPGDAEFEEEEDVDPDSKPWYRYQQWKPRILRMLFGKYRITSPMSTPPLLCCSYKVVNILAAIVQLCFAVITLIRMKGDQIQRYGYAAFGFTVVPFAWMSLINLIGNLLCPRYDTGFIVRSKAFHEVEKLNGGQIPAALTVEGTVGSLTVSSDDHICDYYDEEIVEPATMSLWKVLSISTIVEILVWVPLYIVGGMSGFQPGRSLLYERVWTTMWLISGLLVGSHVGVMMDFIDGERHIMRPLKADGSGLGMTITFISGCIIGVGCYVVVSIGGYVVVANMILEFGNCVRITK